MTKSTALSLLHIVDEHPVQEELDDLQRAFDLFTRVNARANKVLWSLLGGVYAIAPTYANNDAARAKLVARIWNAHGFDRSTRWRPDEKTPHELLLTFLLGIKAEQQSMKSNWLAALNAGAACNVLADREHFVRWVQDAGGIVEAAKLNSQKRAQASGSWASDLDKWVDIDREPFVAPPAIGEESFLDGFAIVLVKRSAAGKVLPVATIANERLIRSCTSALIAEDRRIQKHNEKIYYSEIDENVRPLLAKAKVAWRKRQKKHLRHPLTFAEFVGEDACDDIFDGNAVAQRWLARFRDTGVTSPFKL